MHLVCATRCFFSLLLACVKKLALWNADVLLISLDYEIFLSTVSSIKFDEKICDILMCSQLGRIKQRGISLLELPALNSGIISTKQHVFPRLFTFPLTLRKIDMLSVEYNSYHVV